MACANHWTSMFQVGSHHLARAFVCAGWEVAFVSDPISPWHLVRGVSASLRERFALHRTGGTRALDNRLWTYVPATWIVPHPQPLLRTNPVHRHWPRFTWPSLRKILRQNGFDRVDLIYVDSVIHYPWVQEVPRTRLVYRVCDNNAAFPKSTPAARQMERELAQAADLAVFTAEPLRRYVEELGARRSAYLSNGVHFDHFDRGSRQCPAEYRTIRRPIALYVGSLDLWFDAALMLRTARRLRDVSFVLIGPLTPSARALVAEPNVHCLGPRSYDELPPYLHNADVGLIPFDVGRHPELVDAVNPLKLYEYLACGLPVVAVQWEALRRLGSPARLCTSADEFAGAVRRVLSESPDRLRYRQFAARHDWKLQVARLLEMLGLAA
ncbi:MAG TPA: glycosyltransferase [Gemmataceae bacterium]|nr:glycosyltransferase [Gemmataceae bacterium]